MGKHQRDAANKRLERARNSGGMVDLSGLELTDADIEYLLPAVLEFTSLTSLGLSRNQLTAPQPASTGLGIRGRPATTAAASPEGDG